MHAGRHYTIKEVLLWTRRETLVFALIGLVPCLLTYYGIDVGFLPWPPIAVLGVAVAFVTGFKSNAAYGRLWEARQVWGAIVNASRAWAVSARDFVEVGPEHPSQRCFRLRHIAWLTALRHQLREPRAWETSRFRYAEEYRERTFAIPERQRSLEEELRGLLEPDELAYVMSKKNRAAVLLSRQSAELRACVEAGQLSEHRHVELMRLIANLYDQQGKCERIKNFPYPRQFSTLNLFFVWMFISLLPFAMATEIRRLGEPYMWLTAPITLLVAWVFHTMDKIGEASENPFEGGPNDVPITAMSRAIEIDLRDMADEADLPDAHKPVHNILM
ncbi:MAG TPA: bestrophin family ion channel [Polyangiales bacterium]